MGIQNLQTQPGRGAARGGRGISREPASHNVVAGALALACVAGLFGGLWLLYTLG